jgi:PIN domain nuclease of toxin-antitoxin system
MRCIVDTHAALWLFEGNEKLSHTAQSIIFDDENEIFISILSAWEVAVKVSLNKLRFDGGCEAFLSAAESNNIDILGVQGDYIKIVEKLPYIHRDPFDRLIISTALSENMTIITIDENIRKYGVSWVW